MWGGSILFLQLLIFACSCGHLLPYIAMTMLTKLVSSNSNNSIGKALALQSLQGKQPSVPPPCEHREEGARIISKTPSREGGWGATEV
eukprot:1604506-Amphidinium_carterae.1